MQQASRKIVVYLTKNTGIYIILLLKFNNFLNLLNPKYQPSLILETR